MVLDCPECDKPLNPADDLDDMGSCPRRFRCLGCAVVWERDVSGLLTEVDD